MTLPCALILGACGGPLPPSPSAIPTSSTSASLVTVNGALRGETPAQTRLGPYDAAIAGGEVLVTEGPAAGTIAATDASGAFELRVPAGRLRLRYSRPGFKPAESAAYTLDPTLAQSLSLGKILLRTAPWVITGLALDARANPVVAATVEFDIGGAFPNPIKLVTDSSGRYRYLSEKAHFPTISLSLSGTAIEPMTRNTECCSSEGDTVADLSTLRVLRVVGAAPGTLRVGESMVLPASSVFFDDGSQRTFYPKPSSSADDVVSVSSSELGWVIRANRAGEVTLTVDYRGVTDRVRLVINP